MLALGPERMLGLGGRMGLLGLLLLLLLLLLMLLRLGMKGLTPVSHHLRGVFSLRAAVSGEIHKSLAFFFRRVTRDPCDGKGWRGEI